MPHGIPSGPNVLNPLVISVDYGHPPPHVGPTVPLGTFMQVGSQSVQQPGKQVDSDAWLEVINMSDSVLLPMFDTGIGPLEPIPVGWIWSAPIPISATQLTTTIIVQTAVQFFPNEVIVATVFTRFDLETGHVPRKGPLVPSIPAAAIGPGPLPVGVTVLAEQVLSDATASPDSTFPGPNPYFFTPGIKLTTGMIPFELSGVTVVALLHQLSRSSVNYLAYEIQGSASASNGWALTYTDSGGVQRFGFLLAPDGTGSLGPGGAGALTWDISGNVGAVGHLQAGTSVVAGTLISSGTTITAGTSLTVTNAVASVGGQASTGSFGVAMIVAQALGVNVAVTTLTNILVYAVTTTGWYRINGEVFISNGTPVQTITAEVAYTDPTGTTIAVGMVTSGQTAAVGAQNVPVVLQGTTTAPNDNFPFESMLIHAKTGTNITCRYQDHGGTPNDTISFIIERMA